MRIGMFDSGIGGLTVLKSFIKNHYNNEYIYYGDTLNVPYGEKSKSELLSLSKNIIKFLESKNVDIIIIACGTVSSNVYNELKKITKVPLYNVIDETINYINKNKYESVSIMATNATINSHIFKNKLDIKVYEIACPKLVPLIENNSLNLDETLKEYTKFVDTEALVLGCTHYPIIKDKVKSLIDDNVDIIDMGEVLSKNIDIVDSKHNIELIFSKESEILEENIKRILGVKYVKKTN